MVWYRETNKKSKRPPPIVMKGVLESDKDFKQEKGAI